MKPRIVSGIVAFGAVRTGAAKCSATADCRASLKRRSRFSGTQEGSLGRLGAQGTFSNTRAAQRLLDGFTEFHRDGARLGRQVVSLPAWSGVLTDTKDCDAAEAPSSR
jgi:hypothetical protein